MRSIRFTDLSPFETLSCRVYYTDCRPGKWSGRRRGVGPSGRARVERAVAVTWPSAVCAGFDVKSALPASSR